MRADLPICRTCGVQYPAPRNDCPICEDERQYVSWGGQQWTTLAGLAADGYRGRTETEGPDVIGIGTSPPFAIGQRALLIRAPAGNILWDSTSYLDYELVGTVTKLGGITVMAVSHPHFYGSMIEWSHAFAAPVYVHAADRRWVARPDNAVRFWEGDTCQIADGLTLINLGLHFDGGQVLHWAAAQHGKGALFSGDIVGVARDRRWVSFMRSYPNCIPERPRAIRRALAALGPFAFDRIYGAWWEHVVDGDGGAALGRSARRYLSFALDDLGPTAEPCPGPESPTAGSGAGVTAQVPRGQQRLDQRESPRRPARPAFSPGEVIELFARHISEGNLGEALALYEPEAAYIAASGGPLRGHQITETFQRLAALRPQMRGTAEKVIEAGDIALVNNRWQFSGQRPGGDPVRSSGTSALVLRRRTDGSWGILIDDPWGAGAR
jgi:ketosteroid isomerase-like protein